MTFRGIAAALTLVLSLMAGIAGAAPLRVAVISDLNGSYGSVVYDPEVHAAVRAVIALKPDLVISTGDMVAGQRRPHLSEAELRAMWAGFHAAVSDPLAAAGIPLAVTPGNHDASAYRGFERERRIYAEAWRDRRPPVRFVDGADYPFFYAFDLGGVRFVSLDATTVGRLEPGQMTRLERALADAGPARIVFSHLPLWPVAQGRETEIIGDAGLEAAFDRLEVDLHLSGHHHAFYPGAVAGIGVVAQACLGAGSRKLIGTQGRSPKAVTLLEIAADGDIAVSAVTGPGFDRPLDIGTLPAAIDTGDRVIRRLDRAGLPDLSWQPRP